MTRENDITDVLETDFTTSLDSFGVVSTLELVPGGADIAVTESNKKEYIALVCEHRLRGRVEKQLEAFKRGVDEIVPLSELRVFNEKELEVRPVPRSFFLFVSRADAATSYSSSSLVSARSTSTTGERTQNTEVTRRPTQS
jgi:hypothetical protein